MGYDYSPVAGPPGPISPLPWLKQVIEYTLTYMDREALNAAGTREPNARL